MDTLYTKTPEGTRDRLFSECLVRRQAQSALTSLFKSRGYSEIITPEVEYYDLFVRSGNPIPQESLLKIVDRTGKILVMRPDCTTPIARVAATRLAGSEFPQRLYYNQTIFRSDPVHEGRESEIAQCGIELIGAGGLEGDLEIITMAVNALEAAGLTDFHIELGHSGFFQSAAGRLGLGGDREIRRYIELKDYAGLGDLLDTYGGGEAVRALKRIPLLFGGAEVLEEARELAGGEEAVAAIAHLEQIYRALEKAGKAHRIRFDLGLINKLDYYTGVVFRGYAQGAGQHVVAGGRYDNLLGVFGEARPGAGFAVYVDTLAACLQSKAAVSAPKNPVGGKLKIAITKGRLLEAATEMFQRAEMDCTALKAPGRRLVLDMPNAGMEAVLSKAPDVITYVEHGVCDMGIVGKDTIMECGRSFFEVLDLHFGKCRFALAVKKGSDFYGTYRTRRVATKYPKVAADYFASKGMDVSIIKIEGSVELAPILELADAIVDIVETGDTLKANGLVAIETIQEISARLIVNTASMKLYKREILEFIRKCEDAVKDD